MDQLVHRDGDEVDIHQFGNRSHPPQGRADARAGNRGLGDGGVNDAVGAELGQQAAGGLIGTAVETDILAEDEDSVVTPHLLCLGGRHGLADRHCVHAEL